MSFSWPPCAAYYSWGCGSALIFFCQAEDGIRDWSVTGVQTCALPICGFGEKLGAKAISIYRDGSKRTQPLNTSKDKTPAEILAEAAATMARTPVRRKLPRSEERRVGKEGRARWAEHSEKKKGKGEERR